MKPGMAFANLILAGLLSGHALASTATDATIKGTWQQDIVARATAHANVPTLADAYRHSTDPVTRVLAAMALERIHLNLDKSSEDARLCERSLIDTAPDIALFCAQFANGNLRLARGPAAADPAELEIIRRFTGKVPAKPLQAMQRYVEARRDIPPMHVEVPAGGATIPLVHLLRDDRGALEVEANGTTTRLVMDTGAGPLVLDEETAHRLGVRMLGVSGKARGFLSRDVKVRYGVLGRMRFGPVTITDAPVEVVASRKRIIGLDILRQLGAFRISREELRIYGADAARPACREPMLIGSDIWGNSLRVVIALPIDGELHDTLLDTGSDFYLSGNRQVQDELATTYNRRIRIGDLGPRRHHARMSQATAEVVVSGQPIRMTFGVFADASLPWPYILGSGALRDMDFFLDFQQHHTCLLLHDDLH